MSHVRTFADELAEARASATADTWDPVDGVRYGLGYLCDAVEILARRVAELEAAAAADSEGSH